ncbi:hypothetical protein [Taklimakanibacter lacteus]|uniref:hypothetical protein n=1 Tax=Taklimakanibacter lacteus TaxID=2268456 RepID=UPI000E66BD4A
MNMIRLTALAGIALAAACFAAGPASALTTKECSAKYQAAKEAGTLGDMKWNDFRKAQCGPDASAEIDQPTAKTKTKKTAASDDDEAKGLTSKQCGAKYQAAKEAGTLGDMKWNDFRKAQCGPGASAEIDQPAAKKKTKKAAAGNDDDAKGLTSKQCSAKYQAAKEADALGGMKWNDFRKEQCGPGASAKFEAPKVTKASTASGGGLSMKECSARYQAAKADNSLGSLKWNDFRKAKCSADAADDETVPAEDEATYTNEPDRPTTAAPKGVKFPRGISSKFSKEPEGKARMHTCLQQYYANKESNALGGLKWIQKGGGYYSLCNSRLKGETS